MVDFDKSVTIVHGEIVSDTGDYDDDLARAGYVANQYADTDAFREYHAKISQNTASTQLDALKAFSSYLLDAGVTRTADSLYRDAGAWQGMTYGLLRGFKRWLLDQGYRIGTVNNRLAVIRQYCTLAKDAKAIEVDDYDLIMTVKGVNGKIGRNIDEDRTREGIPTTISTKKAIPAPVRKGQALRLKKETTRPARPVSREHDKTLEARDALLMGLLIEHALRVSEIVGLDVSSFNLEDGLVTIYRSKTHDTNVHKLKAHTLEAAENYLSLIGRQAGPLFTTYENKRITRQGIFDRVRLLGKQVGIDNLSPHDLRHYWTYDALNNGTPIDRVQSGGNWTSPAMVLRYAKRQGIANEGVIISE